MGVREEVTPLLEEELDRLPVVTLPPPQRVPYGVAPSMNTRG